MAIVFFKILCFLDVQANLPKPAHFYVPKWLRNFLQVFIVLWMYKFGLLLPMHCCCLAKSHTSVIITDFSTSFLHVSYVVHHFLDAT